MEESEAREDDDAAIDCKSSMGNAELMAKTSIRANQIRIILILFVVLSVLVNNGYCDRAKRGTGHPVGQWIWTRSDARIFLDARSAVPDLVPCIWVATITASHGVISQRLGCSPVIGKSIPSVAVVVRIDDSLHHLWETRAADQIAVDIDARLKKLMRLLAAAEVQVEEVQLDYDCPERRLSAWAQVVRTVSLGSLQGKPLWITSLPAHLKNPNYSIWFRGAVKGHILQLFDTGVLCNQDTLRLLSDQLSRQGVPFRIGLGAFERRGYVKRTDHQSWFSALPSFAAIPGYKGVWIFPGGKEWVELLSPFCDIY